jgi:uncharacterized membrane protein
MGALPRLIAHHPSGPALVIEGLVLAALVVFFGWIWMRERRRRLDASRRVPEMRD